MAKWEDAPSNDGWEDAPEETSQRSSPTLLQQGAGVAQGIADFAGALPGVIGGTVVGIGDVLINGRDPRVALGGVQEVTKNMNLGNLIPSAETYRKTEGYKYSPGTIAGEAIGKSLEGYGKLAGWAATLAGHEDPEKLDAAMQLALMGGLFALRGRAPKPGTPEFYRAITEELPPAEAQKASKAARDSYGWEDAPEPKAIDTTKYNQMDLPMEEPSPIPPGTRSPYNLYPEEIARLERELNPDAEARVPGVRQGELFTEERALSPDELAARRYPMDEAQQSFRERDVYQREVDLERQPREYGPDINRQEHPYEMTKNHPEAPIPFYEQLTERGKAGEHLAEQRKARQEDAAIPYERPTDIFTGPGRRQRGAIDPQAISDAVNNIVDFGIEKSKRALEGFRGELRKSIVEKAEQTQKNIEHWLENNTPKYSQGERVRSEKTGRIYEIDGYTYHNRDGFSYRYKTPDGESGLFVDSKIVPGAFTKLTGPTGVLSGPGKSQRGVVVLETARKKVAKEGVVRTFQDMKKLYLYDKRPLEQLIKEEGINKDTMQDLAGKGQTGKERLDRVLQKGLSNVAIDRTMAILAQNKGPVGKLVKWVVDNQTFISQSAKVRVEEHVKQALTPWKSLRRTNPKDLRDMLTTWVNNIGKDKLTPAAFKTEKQWAAYKAITEVFTDGWQRVNAAREKAGMKAIDFVENYFPAIREGDYFVHVIDSSGKLIDTYAFKTLREANKEHALLSKAAGEGFTVKPPKLKEAGQYDLSSFSAFEETLNALKKDDPIKDAIRKRYAEISGKRGLGKTAIMKKDIGGALGFEEGTLGVKNAEHVIESYIKRQEAYIANLEKAQLQKELKSSGVLENTPIARKYLDEYLEKTRGADLDKLPLIKDLTEFMSTSVGLGRHTPRNFVKNVSSIASMIWLATSKFLLSQVPQHLSIMPKVTELYQLGDKFPNQVKAYFDGWVESFSPDAISKEARQWAGHRGYLESTIVSMLELKLQDLKGEKWRAVGEGVRWGMGKTEQLLVRTPVFHMLEKALREEVPNKQERFEMAANMMDYYMTHYDREASPLVYDKLGGILGEAARPLKQYSHNNFGQFLEYAQTAKDTGRLAPLATYIGVQALVGGLKGVILATEATAVIALINNIWNTDIPTPFELLVDWDVPDWLIYGGWSTALGADVSSAVSAPSMPSMFSLPPVSFTTNMVSSVWNYLENKIKGTETDQDAMKALRAISPSAMHGWIDYLYSEEGGLIPNPNDKMRGNYPVPEPWVAGPWEDNKLVRFGLNLKSIPEAKINDLIRSAKQLLKGDVERKLNALDAIVDRIENQENLDDALIERYIAQGGDIKSLPKNIKQRMIEQSLTYSERGLRGRVSPSKAHKLDRMKELLDEEMKQKLEKEGTSSFKKMGLFSSEPTRVDSVYGDGSLDGRQAQKLREQEASARATEGELLIQQAKKLFPRNTKKQSEWMKKQLDERLQHEGRDQEEFKNKIKRKSDIKRYM